MGPFRPSVSVLFSTARRRRGLAGHEGWFGHCPLHFLLLLGLLQSWEFLLALLFQRSVQRTLVEQDLFADRLKTRGISVNTSMNLELFDRLEQLSKNLLLDLHLLRSLDLLHPLKNLLLPLLSVEVLFASDLLLHTLHAPLRRPFLSVSGQALSIAVGTCAQ